MEGEKSNALVLPNKDKFIAGIKAVNEFQQVAHQFLIAGADWGVIPGTGNKPTLLKPGAEKIAKLLGLADTYDILDRQEDWQKPFFHFLVRCRLVSIQTDVVISEGLGECNSMENKYRWRWVSERDLPQGTDKTKLIKEERKSKKSGGHWFVYRLENEDIYSQVNTILKMAKKRALVDAALSAGRLSDVFTQDIEDIFDIVKDESTEKSEESSPMPSSMSEAQATEALEVKNLPDDRLEAEKPIKTLSDLQIWALDRMKRKYSTAWLCQELNVQNPEEITDIPKAIQTLKANHPGW